jgi:hypothetical protein
MLRTSKGALGALWAATAAAAFALGRITAPAQAPLAPDDLAGSIRAALGEGDALERLGRTASLLERLVPEELPGVLALYERMIPLLDAWELGPFFSAWARFDPAGALDHALAWPLREMSEERRTGVRATIESWAQADPVRARRAAEELAEAHPRLRRDAWIGLATGWARSDGGPGGLGAFLAELRPTRFRDEAADTALRELVRAGGAEAALGWADTILRDEAQDPTFQRSVFESAVRQAAGFDFERTGAWVMEHAEAAYAQEGLLIVAEHWGRGDGAAVMAWLGEHPAGEPRDRAVRKAFLEWSREDRPGAKTWLDTVSPTAFHDPALEVWAEQLVAGEPVEALGWCERILDPARRERCLESAARSWYARDALAAETWLQQSPLDEEVRSRVRRPPRQEAPGRRRPRGAGAR